jgi:hypothetical protein
LKKYPDQIKRNEVQRQQLQEFFDQMKGTHSDEFVKCDEEDIIGMMMMIMMMLIVHMTLIVMMMMMMMMMLFNIVVCWL